MRLGISPFATTGEVALELSATAVGGGLDTLWLGDGYLANPDFRGWSGGMETFTGLAWLAGRTPGARIGVSAAVLPMRDIPWTAKQANTLHHMADGGFVLVAAPGFWPQDIEARGVSFERRGSVFERELDQLTEDLADQRFSPGPPPGGPPEIWLAGGAATMRRAIDRSLPFQSSRATPDQLAPLARDFFERGGVRLAHRVRVEYGDHDVGGDQVEWHAVTGSVDQLVDAFGRFAEMGVSDLSLIPGQDDDTSRRTVRALVEEVVPQLTGTISTADATTLDTTSGDIAPDQVERE